jgi:hypothetical protein
MKARNHFHFTRANVGAGSENPVPYLPDQNQPIEPAPIRHREPIKIEKFAKDVKKRSKFQRG